ncbi:MAG: hypothetical protein IPL64_10430 [Flavobacteriales bacterium]|nr:hypothetical protein [Flavobacteriales bacterium]
MANTFNMERSNNLIGAIGLAIGVAFGIAGGFFPDPVTQRTIYLISSLGVMAGMLVLSIKFMRKGHDLTAAGLVLFAIAEGMMTSCGSAPEDVAMAGFGAGMAVYAPSFWLICSPGAVSPCGPASPGCWLRWSSWSPVSRSSLARPY